MTHDPTIELSSWNLGVAAGLILLAVAISAWQRLGLGKSLVVGAIRATVQLMLIGHLLLWLFTSQNAYLVIVVLLLMVVAATLAATSRLHSPAPRAYVRWSCGAAILIGSALTLVYVGALVIHVTPWYNPRYLIPIFGMIVGNAMNGAALAAERVHSEIDARRAEIEARLALGASPEQASAEAVRLAIVASMIPTVNALAVVGVVSLPGMMTGQVLAGADPTLAVRYQLVVVFMLTAATAITSTCVALWHRRTFFSKAAQLLAAQS